MRLLSQHRICQQYSKLFLCLLILFYLVGSLQIHSVHKLFHKHQREILHAPEIETNGCHIALFHNQAKGSCAHPTHFTENNKCSWCFAFFQTSYDHTAAHFFLPASSDQSERIPGVCNYYADLKKQNPSRAPPVC